MDQLHSSLHRSSSGSVTRVCVMLSFCGLLVLMMTMATTVESKSWVVPRSRWWTRTKSYGAGRGPYYFVGKRQSHQSYCLANADCPPSHCCMPRGDGSGISTCVSSPRIGQVCYPKASWLGEHVPENSMTKPAPGSVPALGISCECAPGLTCVTLSQQGFGLCIPGPGSEAEEEDFEEEGDLLG